MRQTYDGLIVFLSSGLFRLRTPVCNDRVPQTRQHFTEKLGIDTKIKVEIEASSRDGFDETLQRTVNENCNTLKFDASEFEEEG